MMTTETEAPQVLSAMTPGQIDSQLADLWQAEQKARGYLQNARHWQQRQAETSRLWSDYAGQIERHEAEVAEARQAARPFEAEFSRRGGWSRFFVVNNPGGHVHRERSCSTCYPTTLFGWLPELSGSSEAEMVAEFGEMACTVCFPSAPSMSGYADGTSALARYSEAEKAERRAERAARADAKAAKLLVEPVELPSGRWVDRITTVAAAKDQLRRAVQDQVAHELMPSHYGQAAAEAPAKIALLSAALQLKGMTAEELETLKSRAEKKARKEWS